MNRENQRSFIILILIVIAIICIVSVGYLVLSKDEPDKFNGHWKVYLQERNNSVGFWSFYKNGSMKMISTSISSDDGNLPFIEFEQDNDTKTITVVESGIKTMWGNYKIEGGKFYVSGIPDFSASVGIDYNFINDNKIVINMIFFPLSLTKIEESDIIIDTVYDQIPWENVNISISYFPWERHYNWINLTRSPVPYYGEHAPSEWGILKMGDVIEIGDYDEYVTIWFTWIPNDSYLDSFSFNWPEI